VNANAFEKTTLSKTENNPHNQTKQATIQATFNPQFMTKNFLNFITYSDIS